MQRRFENTTGAALMQQDPKKDGYNKAWKERGEHDTEIIGDAFRILKHKFSEAEWTRLL